MAKKDFVLLLNGGTLKDYLKNKEHEYYKFYSTEEKITNIINSKCLYLSDGRVWNDLEDRADFNNDSKKERNFGLCFSFSYSENIALWLLYGGMEKRGMMLNFTKSMIKDFLEKKEIKLGYFENGKFQDCQKILADEYEINFFDVLYYGKKKASDLKYSIKHSKHNVDDVEYKKIDVGEILKKDYAWSYENETRLVVSIPKTLIKDNRIDTVAIPLSSDPQKLLSRVVLSPNYRGDWKDNPSKLSTKLDWDLCGKCNVRKQNCLKENCKERKSKN